MYVHICTYLVLLSVGSDGVDEWGGAWSLPVETVVLATQLGQQALGWKECMRRYVCMINNKINVCDTTHSQYTLVHTVHHTLCIVHHVK